MKRWLLCNLLGAALGLAWWLCPQPALYNGTFSTAVTAQDGELLRLLLAPDGRYRLRTPLKAMAPAVVRATLAYEDRRFFEHRGVSVPALLRAVYTTYVARTRRVGASTLR